jgi:UDP-glucose 4-epimerase
MTFLPARNFERSTSDFSVSPSTKSSGSSSSSIACSPETPSTSRSLLFDDVSVSRPSNNDNTSSEYYILIVGGLGYIGSHTAWELLKEGYNVVIVDNLSNAYLTVLERLRQMTKKRFEGLECMPRIEFFEADFRDLQTMSIILSKYALPQSSDRKTSRLTGVIHFAAYKAVAESLRQPLKYYANNVAGLVDFCSVLNDFGVKTFIFSSSATVYGELANRGGRLPEELCTHDTTHWKDANGQNQLTYSGCTGLTNPYGRTKWMCEAILNDLAVSDPDWKIFALRYFNPVGCDESGLLGEDPRGTPNNLMPILVQTMTGERPTLNIFGSDWETKDGTAVRDFIHVSDLARGHLAALETASREDSSRGFQVVNLGTGTGQTVQEVVAAMEGVIGRQVPTKLVGRREGDVGVCVAETSRAAKILGWKAQKTIQDSCRDIAASLGFVLRNV